MNISFAGGQVSGAIGSGVSIIGAVLMIVFGGVFALAGCFALQSSLEDEAASGLLEGILISSVFIGVGLSVVAVGMWTLKAGGRTRTLIKRHPNEPWLWNSKWADGRINNSSGLTGALALGGIAIFWNLISWSVVIGIFTSDEAKPAFVYVFLIFPVVGIGLLVTAVYQIARWRKYGNSVFEMTELPGTLGGPLAGLVVVPSKVHTKEGFRVKLKNIHFYYTGTGKHRKRHEVVLWETEQTIVEEGLMDDPHRTALPVFLDIPYDTLPTRTPGENDADISWKLEVTADTPGIDYKATFAVPVFRTPHSDPQLTQAIVRAGGRAAAVSPQTTPAAALDAETALKKSGVRISGEPGIGKLYEFRFKKSFGLFLTLFLFLAFPTAIITAAVLEKIPWFFGLFALVFVAVTLGLATLLFGVARVRVFRDRVEMENQGLFGSRRETYALNELVAIEPKQAMSANNQAFFSLKLVRGGTADPFVVRTNLKGMPLAHTAIDSIQKAMGR
ncbi:MAG: hypothetical protein ACFBZ8_00250 [Opitutales bacterium]